MARTLRRKRAVHDCPSGLDNRELHKYAGDNERYNSNAPGCFRKYINSKNKRKVKNKIRHFLNGQVEDIEFELYKHNANYDYF